MRVTLVCPYAWDRFGGVQTHVRSLADALRRRDHEVVVIAPSVRHLEPQEGVVITGRAVGIPANGSVAPLSFGPVAAAGVRRVLHDFEPELVHLHEPLIPSLSLLALWNAPAPTIGTFHAAAERSGGYKVGRPVLERAARRLSVRTAVSDAARRLAATYFPGDFVITPNGVEVARFASATPLELGPPGRKRVLFFSRLERRKGAAVLLEAMAQIKDIGAELIVAGAGPQERSLRAAAKTLDVDARFLGRVDESEVPGLFKAASVYCAPGIGGESFGIVLLEAMAAGAPVVCSDLPGFRDVASGAAALVRPGDPTALARVLRALLEDPEEEQRMRERSVERAQTFDWGALVGDVERLYEHAIMLK